MADRKITDLTALTTPASADVLPIVDVSEAAAADKNKKITVGELFKGVPDGTAAAPAIAFESDDGNGIFLSTTDTVGIATNGSSRMTVSTTAVTSTLPVIVPDGTAEAPSVAFTGSGTDTGIYSDAANTLAASTGGTNALYIDSSQRVGIKTTSPGDYNASADDLVVASSGDTGITIASNSANAGNIFFTDGTTGVAGYLQYKHNGDSLAFGSGGLEAFRIDSSQRLLVGTSNNRGNYRLQVEGSAAGATEAGELWIGRKLANGSIGSSTFLGKINFGGQSGGVGATILGMGDGAWGTDDYPGRLVFSTTADAASSPTERMRITSGGFLSASNNGSFTYAGSHHSLLCSNNESYVRLASTNGSYTGLGALFGVAKSANSDYSIARMYSGNGSDPFNDLEFHFRGDGNAFADGTWTGGGADYAEYFEWFDSNTDVEDRRGISVVLDGEKIREAVAGEDPIGVISGNPSVVGDAAWNKWDGKYLRDEFGTYIQEDYEVTDDDGNTVIQQRRKLNPAYDPEAEYIPREERPEWDCVGLMGKLRIRKGQVTGSRWIKMRDINDSVEEWLVR